jgi:hypothetical protein
LFREPASRAVKYFAPSLNARARSARLFLR